MADQTNASGSVLDDLLRANKAQKKELVDELKRSGTPAAMGVLASQHLLEWMQENIPCLSLQQRAGLVSGMACRMSQSIEAQEIRESITSWWCRAEDPEAVNATMEILISQGGLPIASRQLLDKCRTRVNEWRLQQRLPRLRQITESWEQLLRWAQAHGQELNRC